MFIVVRYGDGQELLFNPSCRINVLLESIKRKCNCETNATIDLCDEKGNMKKLFEHPTSYATEFISERESLILIKVERKDESEGYKYVSLLHDVFTSAAFLDALKKAEKDTGSVITYSTKTTSKQGKKKNNTKPKGTSSISGQSPRPDREKTSPRTPSKPANRKASRISS